MSLKTYFERKNMAKLEQACVCAHSLLEKMKVNTGGRVDLFKQLVQVGICKSGFRFHGVENTYSKFIRVKYSGQRTSKPR